MFSTINHFIVYSTLWATLFFSLTGCKPSGSQEATSTQRPIVFTSILPQTGLLEKITGDLISIHTLVDEGQSPHAYEPSARKIATLGKASILFTIGVPFEASLLNKVTSLYPDLLIIPTQEHIAFRQMSTQHDHEANCSCAAHGTPDPHVWMTPHNAITITEQMTEALKKQFPEHASTFDKNLATLKKELRALDQEIRIALAPHAGKRFYVYHPSFGYFADEYGLQQIPLESEGKSPSPRQVVKLIEQAKADQATVVLVQKQFPEDTAQALAQAINGTVTRVNPLQKDLISNLRTLTQHIQEAFEDE